MRQANTTFVNLRATLDDLDPLVNASKPVADKLGPFFHTFRSAAHDAVPTITDLQKTIRRPGRPKRPRRADPRRGPAGQGRDRLRLARTAARTPTPTTGTAADNNFTQGAFGESVCSLRNGLPASPSSAPTRRSWSAGSTTSAPRESRTRTAASGASRPPSTPSAARPPDRFRPALADAQLAAASAADRQQRPLPRRQRAQPRRQLDPVHRQRHPRLRSVTGAAGAMRRIALIAVLLARASRRG